MFALTNFKNIVLTNLMTINNKSINIFETIYHSN